MRAAEVQIGSVYVVKVSGRLTRVRVDSPCRYGGWYGTNLATGREVRIRSARRLRRPAPSPRVPAEAIANAPPAVARLM